MIGDEPAVLQLIDRLLSRSGYDVLGAGLAAEATDALAEGGKACISGRPFDPRIVCALHALLRERSNDFEILAEGSWWPSWRQS